MGTRYIPYNPQADPIQYLSQALGNYGQSSKVLRQRRALAALAQSLDPNPTSTINNQRLMSDQGFDAIRGHVLEGAPAQFGQVPGKPLTPQQMMSKVLSSGLPIDKAMGVMRSMAQPTQRDFTLGPGQTRFDPQGQPIAKGPPKSGKTYDVKTIEKYLHTVTTHDKTGKPRKPTRNEIFTLKEITKGSGYKVRKITLQQAKKKGLFGIDQLWPDQKERVQWVLEKADTGEIIMPETEDQPVKINTQAEYDALPSGAQFIDTDGQIVRKQ